MALSAFADKKNQPTEKDIRSVLGNSYTAWVRLIELVSDRIAPISRVWGFTSASTGWGLRLKRNDRVILYMTPRENHFLVSFCVGREGALYAQSRIAGAEDYLVAEIHAEILFQSSLYVDFTEHAKAFGLECGPRLFDSLFIRKINRLTESVF